MAFYNLQKAADRVRYREAFQGELDAALDGSWPRDINDQTRWIDLPVDRYSQEETLRKQRAYVARICKKQVDYIDDLEQRIAAGVAPAGYERA
jgi:hypothetical protein